METKTKSEIKAEKEAQEEEFKKREEEERKALEDYAVKAKEDDGFDVDEFIHYVKTDTTFYMAFKHLRYYTHKYESELNIFNKKEKKIGILNRWGTHFSDGKKAWVVDDSIHYEGKIFSRKIARILKKDIDSTSSFYAKISKIENKYRYLWRAWWRSRKH